MTSHAAHRACALGLLAVLFVALPSSAKLMVPQDFTGVTVVLEGGWELPGLSVRWSDPDGGLWAVRSDGARRLYRPEEMIGLRDAQGRDITRQILPDWALQRMGMPAGQPAPPVSQPPVQTAPVQEVGGRDTRQAAAASEPQRPRDEWRFLLGGEIGWGKPIQNSFDDSEGGLGVDVRARLQVAGALYLAGGYSWQAMPVDRPMPLYPEGDGMVSYDYGSSEEGMLHGYWAGVSLIAAGRDAESARFYLEGGVGQYMVEGLPVRGDDDTFFGYHAGLGFLIPMGGAAAFDLGVRGTHVENLDLGSGDDQHTMVAFRLGLSILAR